MDKKLLEKDLKAYRRLKDLEASIKAELEELKESIMNGMDDLEETTIESVYGNFVIIPESERHTIDRKMMQKHYPNVLSKVDKTYPVRRYLKFKEV